MFTFVSLEPISQEPIILETFLCKDYLSKKGENALFSSARHLIARLTNLSAFQNHSLPQS